MARAAINILGIDGSIIDITSLGKSDIAVDHPGPGQYFVHGTLGMAPPPEGWGYVINQLDGAAAVTTSYADGVLAVSVEKDGVSADLAHSITLHVLVEESPAIEQPQAVSPLAVAQTEIGQRRSIADVAIAPLQDAADIDEATEAETALLKEWKRYRVALNRLPEQPGYPTEIDWPVPPV